MGEGVQLVAVLGQPSVRLTLTFLDNAANLGVDQLSGGLAVRLVLERRRQAVVLRCGKADRTELLAHPPAQHHVPGDLRHLLEVVLGTGRDHAIDELLGRAATQSAGDARPQIVLGIAQLVRSSTGS